MLEPLSKSSGLPNTVTDLACGVVKGAATVIDFGGTFLTRVAKVLEDAADESMGCKDKKKNKVEPCDSADVSAAEI